MKKLFAILLFAGLISFSIGTLHAAPVRKYVRFKERISTDPSQSISVGVPEKSLRTSSSRGDIRLIFDESIPDSVRTAFNYAKEMWEAALPIVQPVYIQVLNEVIEEDIAMVIDVCHVVDVGYEGGPSSLINQITNESYSSIVSPDAKIFINTEISCNCIFSSSSNDYNLPTMALKAMAISFGFGSIIYEDDPLTFWSPIASKSYFEQLLRTPTLKFKDLEFGSPELAAFITSDKVFIQIENNIYDIYSPTVYEPFRSLVYLKDNNSLMGIDTGNNNSYLEIDSATKNILREIGWQIKSYDYVIESNDIKADGIGSSYSSHEFYLSGGNVSIENYDWRFYIKDLNGEYQLLSVGNEPQFTTPKFGNADEYYINLNGDYEGRIECSFSANGKEYEAKPFSVSLERKPAIRRIFNLHATPIDEYYVNLQFDVDYVGADNLTIEIEEEYSSKLGVKYIYEPFIAHVNIPKMRTINYNWITVIAKNKYGEVDDFLEIAPSYGLSSDDNTSSIDMLKISLESPITDIAVYSLQGALIWRGDAHKLNLSTLLPGIYIKKIITTQGVSTHKIIVQ